MSSSSQLAPLSASVTRILSLTGFPKELKTRDIQTAFNEWETLLGGFKIKWIDDTSLMIVFADAGVAKRAYLQALANPPPSIFAPTGDGVASIRPYDGPDAQAIIQSVSARHNNSISRGHGTRASISIPNGSGMHGRIASTSARNGNGNSPVNLNGTIPEHPTQTISTKSLGNYGREPSPTLPSLPTQPTLNSLILSAGTFAGHESVLDDPAIVASSADGGSLSAPPRIGDPGRRMLGAALGMRHPSLAMRSLSGGVGGGADQAMKEVQKAMGGLVVSE